MRQPASSPSQTQPAPSTVRDDPSCPWPDMVSAPARTGILRNFRSKVFIAAPCAHTLDLRMTEHKWIFESAFLKHPGPRIRNFTAGYTRDFIRFSFYCTCHTRHSNGQRARALVNRPRDDLYHYPAAGGIAFLASWRYHWADLKACAEESTTSRSAGPGGRRVRLRHMACRTLAASSGVVGMGLRPAGALRHCGGAGQEHAHGVARRPAGNVLRRFVRPGLHAGSAQWNPSAGMDGGRRGGDHWACHE